MISRAVPFFTYVTPNVSSVSGVVGVDVSKFEVTIYLVEPPWGDEGDMVVNGVCS